MINIDKISKYISYNVPLFKYNWFKVGGNAKIFFQPESVEHIAELIQNIDRTLKLQIIGAGSNIIIDDNNIEGVIIKLGRNFDNITLLNNNLIKVGAGCFNKSLVNFAMHNNCGGLEFLSGIPGSIGGGIAMNAGAYGRDFGDVIDSVTAISRLGEIITLSNKDFNFQYRSHSIKDDLIFLEAKIKYYQDTKENIQTKIKKIKSERILTQPITEKTGGSTFKNPKGYKAWELIDQVGLRGYRIGDAVFSDKHCNFMINMNKGSAKDLLSLGRLAQKKVYDNFGIKLQWEIKYIK